MAEINAADDKGYSSIQEYAKDLQELLDRSREAVDAHSEAVPSKVLFGGRLKSTRAYDKQKELWVKALDITKGINTEGPVQVGNDFVSIVLGGKANVNKYTRAAIGCIDLDMPNEDGTNRVDDLLAILPSLKGTYIEPSTSVGKAHVFFTLTAKQAEQFRVYRVTSNFTLKAPEFNTEAKVDVPGVDVITNGVIFSGSALTHTINVPKDKLDEFKANAASSKGTKQIIFPTRRAKPVSKKVLRQVYINGLPGDEDTIIKPLSDGDFRILLPYLQVQSSISKHNGKIVPYRDNGKLANLIRQFLKDGSKTSAKVVRTIANTLIYKNLPEGLQAVRYDTHRSAQSISPLSINFALRTRNKSTTIGDKYFSTIPPMPVIDGNYEWYNKLMTKVVAIDSLTIQERKDFLHLWLMEYVIFFDPKRDNTVEFFRKAWNYREEDIAYKSAFGLEDYIVTSDNIMAMLLPKSGMDWYKTLVLLPDVGVKQLPLEEQTKIVHTIYNGVRRYALMQNFDILQPYLTESDQSKFMLRSTIEQLVYAGLRRVAIQDDEVSTDNLGSKKKEFTQKVENLLESVLDTWPIQFDRDIEDAGYMQFDVSDGTGARCIEFNTHKLLPAELVDADETFFQEGKTAIYNPVSRLKFNPIYKAIRYTLLPKEEAYYKVGKHKLELALALELHLAYTLYHTRTPLGWGIIYSAEQGTGKTSINAILKRLLFKDLCMPIQQAQLVNRFLPELDIAKLITMEEILNRKQMLKKRFDYDSYIEMLKMASDVNRLPMSREIKGGSIVEMAVDAFFLATSNNEPDSTEGERRAIVFPARVYPDNEDGSNDAILNAEAISKLDIYSEEVREYATYLRTLYEFSLGDSAIYNMLYKEKPPLVRLEETDDGKALVEVADTFKSTHNNTHIYDAVTVLLTGNLSILNNYRKLTDIAVTREGFSDTITNIEINKTIDKYISADNIINRPYPGRYTTTLKGVTIPQDFVIDMIFIAQGRYVEDIKAIQSKLLNVQDIADVKPLVGGMARGSYPHYGAELREYLGYTDGKAPMLKINLKRARKSVDKEFIAPKPYN